MVSKSLDTQFNADWEKAVAFAQLHGIGKDAITPIYQQDAQRLADTGIPMSNAERTRALLAAKNPNNVTPVPSDKPNPASFLGNARTDLRNIFTGLAPNHLIPSIAKTAVDTVLHPDTWINPLENVAKGVTTGNLGDIKKGLEQAGGANSILNWIPGVYDLSELASGGIDQVLEHPIISALNVAPFAPAGRVLTLAASEARVASMASRLGFSSPEAFTNASLPQMAGTWVMARNISKVADDGTITPLIPGIGKLTTALVDDNKKPLTVKGAFQFWASNHSGVSKTVANIAAGLFDMRNYGQDAHIYSVGPWAEAMKKLQTSNPDEYEQVLRLMSDTTLRKTDQTPADIMRNMDLSEDARTAYDLGMDDQALNESRAATGQMVSIVGPRYKLDNGQYTRNQDWFAASGVKAQVIVNHDAFLGDLQGLMKEMLPLNELSQQAAQMDKAIPALQRQLEVTRAASLKVPSMGDSAQLKVQYPDIAKELGRAAISLDRAKENVFGDAGIVDKLNKALSPSDEYGVLKTHQNYGDVVELSRLAIGDLQRTSFAQIDAGLRPEFLDAKATLEQIHEWGKERLRIENRFTDQMLGKNYRRFQRDATAAVTTEKEGVEAASKTTGLEVPKYKKRPKDPAKAEAREAHMAKRSAVLDALHKTIGSYRKFEDAWWDQPADKWRSVMRDYMIEQVLKIAGKTDRIAQASDRLRDLDYSERQIADYLSDEKRLAAFIWQDSLDAHTDPHMPIIDDEEFDRITYGAIDHVRQLKEQGYDVSYLPVLRSQNLSAEQPGRYGAGVQKRIAELSSTKRRAMTMITPERYDVVLQVSEKTREAIDQSLTIEFAATHLDPLVRTQGEAAKWANNAYRDEYANLDPNKRNFQDLQHEHFNRLGLSRWNPREKMGFSLPRWGNEDVYVPAGIAKALDELLDGKKFRADSVYDKGTNLFRFSILALSPRYTAHIVFGGLFLLALRSDPRILSKFGDAYKMVKEGTTPRELRQGATEIGVEHLPTNPVDRTLHELNSRGAVQGVHTLVQEILGQDGIIWSKASPVEWTRALGELNYRFTNFVSSMYRAAAMLDYSAKAEKRGYFDDPVTGQRIAMTKERAQDEGIRHAQKVMGNLKAMTPLERSWFMRIMPFYGWTRHILDYVLTYPVDHPYRASFLSTQAALNSDSVAKSIDTRILFMFFMGSPDAQGNVKGVDTRFLDPLRDVANYASWSGWISALNPAIEAPLAMIDPNLVYGSTSLYPNVTYDQFYGIETSAPQGNSLLTGASQFVGQIGALEAGIQLAGNYRSLATKNPNQFYKTVFESLNIPFAQVQDLNLKQLAVKGELARYRVAETAANNAWTQPGMGGTGIEKSLAGYASVPDPLNTDYEVTPAQLQNLYNALLAAYPGQNPSDAAIAPPTPPVSYAP